MILALAFRNMLRKPGRTFAALAALSGGAAAVVLSGGFISYVMTDMQDLYIRGFVGHIQIHRKGYSVEGLLRPFDFMLKAPALEAAEVRAISGVKEVSSRIEFYGLLSSGETTFPVAGMGVEPGPERRVSGGESLDSGMPLEDSDTDSITVGRGVAKAMGIKPGDCLVLLANGKSGSLGGTDVRVKGVFYTASKDYDDYTIMLPLKTAQRLLHVESVHTIRVLLAHTAATGSVMQEILRVGAKRDIEAIPWYEIAEFVSQTSNFYERLFGGLKIAIMAMVVLGIFNTLNMSVMERLGEIGTMMALGATRYEVLKVFIVEGALLGVVGGGAGGVIGAVTAIVISHFGIHMPSPPGSTLEWTARISVVPAHLCLGFSIAFFAAVISSAFPAFKASRSEISVALRSNVRC